MPKLPRFSTDWKLQKDFSIQTNAEPAVYGITPGGVSYTREHQSEASLAKQGYSVPGKRIEPVFPNTNRTRSGGAGAKTVTTGTGGGAKTISRNRSSSGERKTTAPNRISSAASGGGRSGPSRGGQQHAINSPTGPVIYPPNVVHPIFSSATKSPNKHNKQAEDACLQMNFDSEAKGMGQQYKTKGLNLFYSETGQHDDQNDGDLGFYDTATYEFHTGPSTSSHGRQNRNTTAGTGTGTRSESRTRATPVIFPPSRADAIEKTRRNGHLVASPRTVAGGSSSAEHVARNGSASIGGNPMFYPSAATFTTGRRAATTTTNMTTASTTKKTHEGPSTAMLFARGDLGEEEPPDPHADVEAQMRKCQQQVRECTNRYLESRLQLRREEEDRKQE
ncbi:unnamed protein product, partial [Amoebophrya sp. A25]|eukprot:GSA25T00003416001.1